MTREIKFRAWDKHLKIMVYNNENNSADYWDGVSASHIALINNLLKYNNEVYEYMQFTGLKDKAGKEIYEGDVIDRGNNAIVCFNNGRFQPVYDGGTSEDMEDDFYLFANRCFVIGNIYENKDLLSNAIDD